MFLCLIGDSDTTQDTICTCVCSRCLCCLFELSGAGSGQCGVMDYDKIISTGTKRTAEQISAWRLKQDKHNKGERDQE